MDHFFLEFFDPQNPLHAVGAFVLVWILVSLAVSLWSGWWTLAEYYPGQVYQAVKTWRFQSASMRMMMGYNNILTVAVGEKGMGFSPFFILRLGHPPLFIPWDQIRARRDRFLFMQVVTLSFKKTPGIVIRISHRLAARVEAASAGRFGRCFT